MGKALTLLQQYERQLNRINRALDKLADEGYIINKSEWLPTQNPKSIKRDTVANLKEVTPKALRRASSPEGVINIGKSPVRTVRKAAKMDFRKVPKSKRPAKNINIRQSAPRQDDLIKRHIMAIIEAGEQSEDAYARYKAREAEKTISRLLASADSDIIYKALASAEDYILTALASYIYDSEQHPDSVDYMRLITFIEEGINEAKQTKQEET